MEADDLRSWLEKAKNLGELRLLEHADWNLEIGAITEIVDHRGNGPALLFDKIKDYPAGYRVLTNAMGSVRRVALTLGVKEEFEHPLDFVRYWKDHVKTIEPIPHKIVADGPILENVQSGKEVNVFKFPAPKWCPLDGGRYIGTGDVVVTRDPEEGWVNLGTYRVMLADEQHIFVYMSPGKHGRIHREKCFAKGQPCKVAVSFGHDPALLTASSLELPYGLTEYDYVGGIKGYPYEVVKAPFTGLPIPAASEIVMEGEMLPDDLRMEGPFGEFTGYYASHTRPEPVVKIHTILHRHDPIILGSMNHIPPCENSVYQGLMRSALIWDELESIGIPDVRGVWCEPAGTTRMWIVVAIKQRYPGHAAQAGMAATQTHGGAYMGRYVIVVDEDIDPTDMNQVIWAISTRSDPELDIDIKRRMWSGPLDPIIPKDRKGLNTRAVIDACRPYEWMSDFPLVARAEKEFRDKTLQKWKAQIF
ncbi:MAG: UbiD family decarboxylase [Candidatus Tectomicrobia bacterium]|nr:UbiD family decarboxylase [Candidatus Tectomicrobia bacterium]